MQFQMGTPKIIDLSLKKVSQALSYPYLDFIPSQKNVIIRLPGTQQIEQEIRSCNFNFVVSK